MRQGEIITAALRNAGLGELPPPAKAWAASRLARYRFTPEATNVGGIGCALPHDHTDGLCLASVIPSQERTGEWRRNRVRYLARCGSWDDAARLFVATARRAGAEPHTPEEDIPEVGFRSVHPADDERTGDIRDVVRDAADIAIGPLSSKILFGPSAEMEIAFRSLLADWESFERAGVPDKIPELTETHRTWIDFRDRWLGGRPGDAAELNTMINDANRVRKTLAEKSQDPAWKAPEKRGVDIDKQSLDISVMSSVLKELEASPLAPLANPSKWWAHLSPGTKLAAGAGVVVVGLGALAYVSAPVMLALGGLGGRGPQVVVVEPAQARQTREPRKERRS